MAKLKFYTFEESRIDKESERLVILLPNGENITVSLGGENEVLVQASTRINLMLYYGGASIGVCVGDKE